MASRAIRNLKPSILVVKATRMLGFVVAGLILRAHKWSGMKQRNCLGSAGNA